MDILAIRDDTVLSVRDDIGEFTDRFLASLDVKRSSRSTYRRRLGSFRSWWESEKISNPSRETILTYKSYLEGRKLSALTISAYLVTIQKFFEWLESVKVYPNIAKGIKGMKQPRGYRKEKKKKEKRLGEWKERRGCFRIRKCLECQQATGQVFYDDYRPGAPYAYYQCTRCGTRWYKCVEHGTFTALRVTDAQEGCECYQEQQPQVEV